MAIVWESKNPGATDEAIKEFEDKERLILPEGYKAFLREMNGGVVETGGGYIPYLEHFGKDAITIEKFLSLEELSIARRNLARDGYFPDDLLYIAHTMGGHQGIVAHLGSEEISIWFDYWGPQGGTLLIGSTFADFLRVVRSGEWNEEDVI